MSERTPFSEAAACRLRAEGLGMNLEFFDFTDPGAVCVIVRRAQPDVVLHMAAIAPPDAYCLPSRMWDINVRFTDHLLAALASELTHRPLFVLASSYAGMGSNSSMHPAEEYTSDFNIRPMCAFGHSKAVREHLVRSTWLGPWVIVRLGASMSLDAIASPAMLTLHARRLFFAVPHAQRRHGCDLRDVGLALAIACVVDPQRLHSKVLYLVGDDTWNLLQATFMTL